MTAKPGDQRIVNSIAVLPFHFLTDEAKDGGLELGLTEPLAIIYTSLGDKQKAIEYLGQAYEKRDPQIVPIKVFPPFESLRQEQKFSELLRRMNL